MKAEVTRTQRVITLTLNEDEARAVFVLLGRTSGGPNSPQTLCSGMFETLSNVGMKYDHNKVHNLFDGMDNGTRVFGANSMNYLRDIVKFSD